VQQQGRPVGQAILDEVGEQGVDLIFKGAYTQSRLRQMIFGGATRRILSHATVPVLMAH
ncbi:MAG: universal stress protein, partial [Candidatus Competibacteraceae bacterium]|nr:universal stress protein [Candidatus Competibacteraceae bacterium]